MLPAILLLGGVAYAAAMLFLVWTEALLGSPIFFGVAGVTTAIYGIVMALVWRRPAAPRRWLWVGLGLAVLLRVPLVLPRWMSTTT